MFFLSGPDRTNNSVEIVFTSYWIFCIFAVAYNNGEMPKLGRTKRYFCFSVKYIFCMFAEKLNIINYGVSNWQRERNKRITRFVF